MANIVNRRKILAWAASLLCTTTPLFAALSADKRVIATQVIPEPKRTRIIIETSDRLKYRYFVLHNPERLVLDLEGVTQNEVLATLPKRIQAIDNYVKNVRLGQKDSKVMRIVFDLKQMATIQVQNISNNGKNIIQIGLANNASGQNTEPATKSKGENKNNDDPLLDLIKQKQKSNSKPNQSSQSKSKSVTNNTNHATPVIVIDAGHGGKDPGAMGAGGLLEKVATLQAAIELRNRLEAKGYIVHLTRSTDIFIPLRERRQRAHKVNADLFISIHANASEVSTMRGADVFIWGQANSERAKKLAREENNVDLIDGMSSVGNKDVDAILNDMMQTQTTADSMRVGNLILRHLGKTMKLRKNTVETADFVVLRSVDIPSVLIEMVFLSNPEDEKLLRTTAFHRNVATAIADAVHQYFAKTTK